MEADGAVDAQNAPTVPWKTLCVFHELPQGLSNQITHEKPRKAPKWRWETRIDPNFVGQHFWARGYFVSTVGRDERIIRDYIQQQEREDRRLDQLPLD